jgi:hypothetical protein
MNGRLKPDYDGFFNPNLPAADQMNIGANTTIDVESWISAGQELFTETNIFSYERPPIKNFVTTSKSLYLDARVESGTETSPEVISIRSTFQPEDVTNLDLTDRLYFPICTRADDFPSVHHAGNNWSADQLPTDMYDNALACGYTYTEACPYPEFRSAINVLP